MSEKSFKILNTLIERLKHCKNSVDFPKYGIVFGFTSTIQNTDSFCIGCVENAQDIPFGYVLNGIFTLENFDREKISKYCEESFSNKKSGKFIVLSCNEEEVIFNFYDVKTKNFCNCLHEIADYHEAVENLVLVRLEIVLNKSYLSDLLSKLEDFETLVFILKNSKTYRLTENSENKVEIENLYDEIDQFEELDDSLQIPANMKKKMIEKFKKKLKTNKSLLEFQLLLVDDNKTSPQSELDLLKFQIYYHAQLKNTSEFLRKLFLSSLNNIFQKIQPWLNNFQKIKIFNFYEPSYFTHITTTVFENIDSEEKFKNQRKTYHIKYLIPMTKPAFKPIKQIGLESIEKKKLINVHRGLTLAKNDYEVHCVKGTYIYYHYNQDNANDSGWGCAYRSLQTIISWFLFQGYIYAESVPNHRQIQQALIDVNDKSIEFLGSSKWIGSQEVCYVLGHLYEIQSKIIFINSSTELANKAREIIQHFVINATPIMIGGGVLAHTILGISFNEKTGDVKFLVLDPHYTGDDDLNVILKKVQLVEIQKGKLKAELLLTEDCVNILNTIHGGMSATLVDQLSSIALRSYFDADGLDPPKTVSTDLSLSFLSAVPKGNTIRVEAEVIRVGRKMAFLTANIYDKNNGKLAVTGKHTKFIL